MESRPLIEWHITTELLYTAVSSSKEALLSLPAGSLLGASFFTGMEEDDARMLRARLLNAQKDRPFTVSPVRYKGHRGSLFVTKIVFIPEYGEHGDLIGFLGQESCLVVLDRTITNTVSFETVFGALQTPTCFLSLDKRFMAGNASFVALCGISEEQFVGADIHDFALPGLESFDRDFALVLAGETVPERKSSINGRDYLLLLFPIYDVAGNINTICAIIRDVTTLRVLEHKLEEANRKLSQMNVRDYLTGVFNRLHFERFLSRQIRERRKDGNSLSLIMIDIDHYKAFNDAYGHLAGDNCLIQVAESLNGVAKKEGGSLFRYGGEEFSVLFVGHSQTEALVIADALRKKVESLAIPHCKNNGNIVTISLGVATVYPAICQDDSKNDLIKRADAALYEAKKSGRNRVCSADEEWGN